MIMWYVTYVTYVTVTYDITLTLNPKFQNEK